MDLKNIGEGEKQLISCLNWFRTRYALFLGLELDRKATKNAIDFFGKSWIGSFKKDWSAAFTQLKEKGILSEIEESYAFTELGQKVKDLVESEIPFFKYEYDNYFQMQEKSEVHASFCERIYGKDLSQHGLVNLEELELLVQFLKKENHQNILDIGCGNGRITKYLSEQCESNFLGIDMSSEGIRQGKKVAGSNIDFEVWNMNDLVKLPNAFDAIITLDTLYYGANLKDIIQSMLQKLNKDGKIYAYFSQWIMDAEYSQNLEGANTNLAKALKDLKLEFKFTDLTDSGIKHWKDKLQALEEMKPLFEQEGKADLWNYRYGETSRYGNWEEQHYARYFYEISNY